MVLPCGLTLWLHMTVVGPRREGPKDCNDGITIHDEVTSFEGCGQGGAAKDFVFQFEVERGLEWKVVSGIMFSLSYRDGDI